MKNSILFIALLFVSFQVIASTDTYKKVMKEKIQALYEAKSIETFQQLANDFERISQKETEEWLPLYYAAYGYINLGFKSTESLEEKDAYFRKANNLLQQAYALSPNNSEISALKGYSKLGELSADASNRGQSLSPQVMQLLGTAIQQDNENPRALFMMAQMEYGMARFFNSSTEKACNYAQKSVSLYESEPTKELLPSWGKNAATEMASRCQ